METIAFQFCLICLTFKKNIVVWKQTIPEIKKIRKMFKKNIVVWKPNEKPDAFKAWAKFKKNIVVWKHFT